MRLSRSTFLALFLLLCPSFAHALSVRAVGATLYVNEVPVLTLRSHAGGRPAVRCARLADTLVGVEAPAEVRIRRSGRSAKVIVGFATIVVKRAEARAHGMSALALAQSWAAGLREALALPALQISPQAIDLPVGGTKDVRIVGSEAFAAHVEANVSGMLSITRRPGVLHLRALRLGKVGIVAIGPTASGGVAIRVLPWAAHLPQELAVSVTGSPATREVVRGSVERAIRTQLRAVPDAWISFSMPPVDRLPGGDRAVVPIRVRIGSPESLSVSGVARVSVRNLGLGSRNEAELWYCNDPENIKKAGVLFGAELRRERPVRLLFHHVNESAGGLTVDVRVLNLSDKPARIMLIPGEGTPDKNPVLAGAEAGDQFLRNWILGSGEVVWLPAHSSIPLSTRRLGPGETTSGLCCLRLLEGGPSGVYLRAVAREPSQEDSVDATAAPWRHVRPRKLGSSETRKPALSDRVYPNPFRNERVEYVVGGKHGFVFVGEQPIERADQRSKLDGNFGVIYTIDAQMRNPTKDPVRVEIVFQSSTGYSGGMFLVDGKMVRSPMQQPKDGFRIWQETLQPGSTGSCRIVTVPLSGSCYPATLTVRSADTLASIKTP